MNIIFGDARKELADNFTVLELDTFKTPEGKQPVTAYCVVETMPLHEFPLAEAHKKIHEDLINAYRNKHWDYCKQAIEGLTGKWNGELDTFYSNLLERINQHAADGVSDDWDGILLKS